MDAEWLSPEIVADCGAGRIVWHTPTDAVEDRQASGASVNKIDLLGLYQEDVHYYMMCFLVLVAVCPSSRRR